GSKRRPKRSEERQRPRGGARASDRPKCPVVRAARQASQPLSPPQPGASKSRPASCIEPRSENGYRHIHPFPAFALWLAQSALRRDQPAVSEKNPVEKRAAKMSRAALPRADAKPRQNPALLKVRASNQSKGVLRRWLCSRYRALIAKFVRTIGPSTC